MDNDVDEDANGGDNGFAGGDVINQILLKIRPSEQLGPGILPLMILLYTFFQYCLGLT